MNEIVTIFNSLELVQISTEDKCDFRLWIFDDKKAFWLKTWYVEYWQRWHEDYFVPFLGRYYAVILIDPYSKWAEVCYTTTDNAAFTTKALHKMSSRVGVPTALVTDNGTHFMVQEVRTWLRSVGCRHLLTPPRHQQSNGTAKILCECLKGLSSP